MASTRVNKVVLAYSGGLDTSIILKWIQETYRAELVTFTADLGQGEELEPARRKAEMLGIKETYIQDLREEFARDFVFPMFRMNALYEGVYLLGTSIARPLIAKRLVEIAHETGADAILAMAGADANKARLKQQTEEAQRRGIFGAPMFLAEDGEMFWGNDRLEQAIRWAARQPERSG